MSSSGVHLAQLAYAVHQRNPFPDVCRGRVVLAFRNVKRPYMNEHIAERRTLDPAILGIYDAHSPTTIPQFRLRSTFECYLRKKTSNRATQQAYLRAVKRFSGWCTSNQTTVESLTRPQAAAYLQAASIEFSA